jgi:hypothetical protein
LTHDEYNDPSDLEDSPSPHNIKIPLLIKQCKIESKSTITPTSSNGEQQDGIYAQGGGLSFWTSLVDGFRNLNLGCGFFR